MKKSDFCKLKASLNKEFVYSLQTFQVRFGDFLANKIQQENNFLPTRKHRQAEVCRFLGICLNDCFIYRANFVFRKFLLKRDAILASVTKH